MVMMALLWRWWRQGDGAATIVGERRIVLPPPQ
jgi:hypothetical protein